MTADANNDDERYLAGVISSNAARSMTRLAVIAERGVESYGLQLIRETVPTFALETLRELRGALGTQAPGEVIALDVRLMPLEDVLVLAPCLRESRGSKGLVYVITTAQFELLGDVDFDFVYR